MDQRLKPEKRASVFARLQGEPITAPLRSFIPDEIERMQERLEAMGIEQTRIGMEMEFGHIDAFPRQDVKWKIEKERYLQDSAARIARSPVEVRGYLLAEREEIAAFNAREWMMFAIHQKDAQEGKYLEPLFGRGHDGDGYYDGGNCVEIKLAHTTAAHILGRKEEVLKKMADRCARYSLDSCEAPGYHINTSFWKDGKNLFCPDHAEFRTAGRAITEGMTRTLYDASPLMMDQDSWDKPMDPFIYSLNRNDFARAATGRYETRLYITPEKQDPDLMTLIALTGAVFGLENLEGRQMRRARVARVATLYHEPRRYKVLSHVLGNAEIRQDGSLDLPRAYLRFNIPEICYELGLTDKKPTYIDKVCAETNPMTAAIEGMIQKVRVEDGKLVWPEEKKGVVVCRTEEINMDILPPDMQERMRGGECVSRKEMISYMRGGMSFPQAGKVYEVDLRSLQRGLKLVRCEERLVMTDGYDMKRAARGMTLAQTRVCRLKYSEPLRLWAPATRAALRACMDL